MKKKRGSFGFSWADEVEEEEDRRRRQEEDSVIAADEARLIEMHNSSSRRPDPFGSARPREVVLEEKGVDWRRELQRQQPLDHSSALRKGKMPKRNFHDAAIINRKEAPPLRGRCLAENRMQTQQTGSVSDQVMVPRVYFKEEMHHALVPPIRYSPKHMETVLEEMQRHHDHHHYHKFDVRWGNSEGHLYETDSKLERAEMNLKYSSGNFLDHEMMGHWSKGAHCTKARDHCLPNMERTMHLGMHGNNYMMRVPPITESRRENAEFGCKRWKQYGENYSNPSVEAQGDESRRILVTTDMEKVILHKNPEERTGETCFKPMRGESRSWRRMNLADMGLKSPPFVKEVIGWRRNDLNLDADRLDGRSAVEDIYYDYMRYESGGRNPTAVHCVGPKAGPRARSNYCSNKENKGLKGDWNRRKGVTESPKIGGVKFDVGSSLIRNRSGGMREKAARTHPGLIRTQVQERNKKNKGMASAPRIG